MVKIITSDISYEDLERQINEWNISDRNIKSITLSSNGMHDLFYDGNVCNQWISYTAVIIY